MVFESLPFASDVAAVIITTIDPANIALYKITLFLTKNIRKKLEISEKFLRELWAHLQGILLLGSVIENNLGISPAFDNTNICLV